VSLYSNGIALIYGN